jgi:cytochrome c oxidase cbb3-type subunit 3
MVRALVNGLLCLVTGLVQAAAPTSVAEGRGQVSDNSDIRHEQGRKIYNYRCYFCHGYSGDARTLTSTFVEPPPRNFTTTGPDELTREQMIEAVSVGRPGTAMTSFSRVLTAHDIELVVDFVRREFIQNGDLNTRYHSEENGWPDHDRYLVAYPFATGELPVDGPWEALSAQQVVGKRLFLATCITCHDRARVEDEGAVWRKQSISYPRNNYSHTEVDAVSSASIYAIHDVTPQIKDLSQDELRGQGLWLQNCAFCHAADGTGQNWIGSFLEPPPRDLTNPDFMRGMTRDVLMRRIEDGLPNTSMPAWKHVLDREQIEHIISYISRAFHPVGPGSPSVAR